MFKFIGIMLDLIFSFVIAFFVFIFLCIEMALEKYLPRYISLFGDYWLAIWSAPVRYSSRWSTDNWKTSYAVKRKDSYLKALRITIRKGEFHENPVRPASCKALRGKIKKPFVHCMRGFLV